MSYDFEDGDRNPPKVTIPTADSRDLETIVSLLELAAISLTNQPDQTFTRDDLVREARVWGGAEIHLEETDISLVLPRLNFLKRKGQNYRLK